jgi:ATP-dependent Clp protease ATP-binding subunit ClpC
VKRVTALPVVIIRRHGAVYGELLGASELGAFDLSVGAVLEKLEPLAREALESGRLDEFEDRQVHQQTLAMDVPVLFGGEVIELPMALEALYTLEAGRCWVYLPQIGLEFETATIEQLEVKCLEHLRSRLSLEERLDALGGLVETTEQASKTIEVHQLEVRIDASASRADEYEEEYPTLAAVGEPLHQRLAKKDAARAWERKGEVGTLLNYLAGVSECSVVLIGPAGVGKTAIVHEAVGAMIRNEAPDALQGLGVWQISGGRLMAGMRFLGQWQERVIALIEEVKASGAILYAENLIELLETSGTEEHAGGIPGLLLPHILAGEIVLVTEIRPEQVAVAEQRHPGFMRALRRLPVEPMNPVQTDAVLDRLSFRLGREHGVRLSPETRQKVIELVGRFQGPAQLPGPAVELAERMARTQRGEAPNGDRQQHPVLLPRHAVEAYGSMTGLPVALLDPGRDFDLAQTRAHFESAIVGQQEAVDAMVDLITVLRAGLHAPTRPLGSYLFLGPTGVGKTQTALTLAKYLFGSSERMIRLDMSEYQDSWSAARLVGRYKGEQGDLVRRIREQPFQVILLDEIEKAHASVFDYLLQMLGEGRLTDALGQTVSLCSAVVVMTSNLGAGGPAAPGFSQGRAEVAERSKAVRHYLSAIEEFFRPEFVGRLDRIITFAALGRESARQVVERVLADAFVREGLVRRNLKARVEPDVVEYLIEKGFDERYGARPLRQAVEQHIIAPMASFLAQESDVRDMTLVFSMQQGRPALDLQ